MKTTFTTRSDTQVKLVVELNEKQLKHALEHAVEILGKDIKVPGFRAGKAPAAMIEKAINPALLQEEFLNDAVNHGYTDAVTEHSIKPVARPQIDVTKFVPYTLVEFTVLIPVISAVKLGKYKGLKVTKTTAVVSSGDVEKVLDNMQLQLAEKTPVERAAKNGDEAVIDFDGVDQKGVSVKGASSKAYPLTLGSSSFIPGFEEHVVGMKPQEQKSFGIVFPKDYSVKALQSKNVTFTVKLQSLNELNKPAVDDAFVKKVAPTLTSVAELKTDIKKQLLIEAEARSKRDHENALLAEIIEHSDVSLPEELVAEQAKSVQRDLTQNIMYRGQTMEEYLEAVGMTAEEQHQKEVLPEATRRLKGGIILGEIADKEGITLSPDELQERIATLKMRYQSDAKMLAEMDKPESREQIGGQLITEKTIARLLELNK